MIPLNNASITSYYKKVRIDDKGNMKLHTGLDLISTTGDKEVKSIANGTVRGVFFSPKDYGNYVSVQLDNNIIVLYCHLEKVLVKVNQQIKEGNVIGIEGKTGNSTGVHLHLELRRAGQHISPADFLGIVNENGLVRFNEYEQAKKTVQEKAKLADKTIEYLDSYEFNQELFIKLAKAMI
jgi:murein DD-endopeptidase MepM/ murein hydrolase activator NlpD